MPRVDGLRRCGECATCLNPAAKQACLRNKELREEKQRAEAEEQARQELERRARAAAEDAQRAAQEAAPGPQQQQQRPEPPGAGLVAAGSSAQPKYTHERRLLLFTARYEFVRHQHVNNAVLLLRQAVGRRDWWRVAALVATLLASDRAENLSPTWMFRHPHSRARLAEALEAGRPLRCCRCWLLLQQEAGQLSYEQTRRYLRQWAVYQLAPAGRDAVHLQLARYSRAQGHATDAWDFLCTLQFATAPGEAQRHALMAEIRADAWTQAMRSAAQQQLLTTRLPPPSPNKRRRGGPPRPAAWQPWQHNPQVSSTAGRMAKELHQEAVECCRKSLEQRPDASDVATLLAQLQLGAGDASGALATARKLRLDAALDADAAGLLALLLIAQPQQLSQAHQLSQSQHGAEDEQQQQQQDGAATISAAAAAEAAECLCQLLAGDPSQHTALAALLAVHAQQPLPPATLVAGLCLYLEAQAPTWLPPTLELRAWQHLAASLTQAAVSVLQHHRRLQELQRQRLELLPRCLPQLQRQRQQLEQGSSQEGEDSSEEQERWQQLQQLSAAAADAQRQLGLAAELHAQCCAALRGRLWWRDAHLLPQPAATVAAALQDGGASPDALLALAAVNAFIHPLWLAQVVQEWRASRCTKGLPRLMQNLMTRHTAAALQQGGHPQQAAALRDAAKLCREAAAVAAAAAEGTGGGGAAVAGLASVARQRADFWRAARRPWKPPAGWLPIPLGARHPQLGRIAALPPQWWACFPQFRRRLHQGPTSSAAAAAAAAAAAQPVGTPQAAGPQEQQAGSPAGRRGAQQQPQALRRLQPAGVRSILKGSQQQDELPGTQQQSQPSPDAAQLPPSARAGRRVQFQLPQPPAGAQQEQQGADPMQVDGGQQNGAAAAAPAAGGHHQPKKASKGRRSLLPPIPAALAEEEGGGEGEGGASWRQRLQRRRSSAQQAAGRGGF